ncbi:MAG: dephospho-CoA kinase, partial [Bacteroidota bacterium]
MIVGITGGIGSGKSMVCKCLRTMGYLVFDADLASRQLLEQNKEVRSQVMA